MVPTRNDDVRIRDLPVSEPASPSNRSSAGRRLRGLVRFLAYLYVSGLVLLIFVVRPGIDGAPRASFPDMIDGTAYKPFVTRALVPVIVRVVAAATPEIVHETVRARIETRRLPNALGWDTELSYEYLVAIAVMWLFLLGFVYALRHLVGVFYDYPPAVTDLAPLAAVIALPFFFAYYNYLNDPPTLFFFAAGTALVHARRLRYFYPIFFLATLNKETSILLVVLYAVWSFRDTPRTKLAAHVVSLFLIWGVTRALLVMIYRDNPGPPVEFHLLDHNLRLPMLHPVSLVRFLAAGLALALVLRTAWGRAPRFLKTGFLVTTVPLVTAALFVGYIDELRDYYETLPFVFLLVLPPVVDALTRRS